jgi:antitoxin ParD1/3/4
MPKKRSKPRQTTMNISLPTSLRSFVAKRVEEGSYGNASELIRDLLRGEERRIEFERRRLVRMVEEGLASGPGRVADDRFWAELEAGLLEHGRKRRKAG